MYRPEEGHEEDVRDEVHEQEPDHQEGRCTERVQRDRDTEDARASLPRQPLVHLPGKRLLPGGVTVSVPV